MASFWRTWNSASEARNSRLSLPWVNFWLGCFAVVRIALSPCLSLSLHTYPQIRPCRDLLQPLANLLEAGARLLDQVLDALAHALGFLLRAEQADLALQLVDAGGQGEELLRQLRGEAAEFGVVAVERVIFAAEGGGLGFEGGGALEGHGSSSYSVVNTTYKTCKARQGITISSSSHAMPQ